MSLKTHELQTEKKEEKDVPCELGNVPSIPILPLERFQWTLAQVCEHGEGIRTIEIFSE